jgi:hypothetical protein
MRNKRYSDVICQAEAIVQNPANRTRRGTLRTRAQRRVDRLVVKITYLSQFEEQESINF